MLLRATATAATRDADGWLATGDVGPWAADGRLYVHGRRGDLIITGGENVWPAAVERVLQAVPGIAEIAVVGRPDPEWGQAVTAIAVASGQVAPTLGDLRRTVKEVLPGYCAPRLLYVVDAIPRTALGKPRRTELRRTGRPAPDSARWEANGVVSELDTAQNDR